MTPNLLVLQILHHESCTMMTTAEALGKFVNLIIGISDKP